MRPNQVRGPRDIEPTGALSRIFGFSPRHASHDMPSRIERADERPLSPVPRPIFGSRWLQLPPYLGLILAQCVYVCHLWVQLVRRIGPRWATPDRSATSFG